MKKWLFIFASLILVNCGNKSTIKNDSIIGREFQNFKQINQLKNYAKVSDTTIYDNNIEPLYKILHLQDKSNNLIIFKSIILDSIRNLTFKILDTLIIPNSKKSEFITIGYCYTNNGKNENIIAIVDKTDSLRIQNIRKVWKANVHSKKIERVNNLSKINCFNEFFVNQ